MKPDISEMFDTLRKKMDWAETNRTPYAFIDTRKYLNEVKAAVEAYAKDCASDVLAHAIIGDIDPLSILQQVIDEVCPNIGVSQWLKVEEILKPLTDSRMLDTNFVESCFESRDLSQMRSDFR
jgi:hypothetical protein